MRALAALLVLAGTVVPVVPADVASRAGLAGFCPDANGVTVVIDFQDLGGTSIVRCAPGTQATGLDALQHAGIQVTGTARWGLGFICRIEGRPGPDTEPCIDTPPASAYWSYWYASNGGSWHYSEWGVKNRTPPAGSFEGWSFSHDRTASTNPPPRIAPVRPASPGDGSSGGRSSGGRSDAGDPGGGRTAPPAGNRADSASPPASASAGAPASAPMGAGRTPGPADTPTEAPGWTGGDDPQRPAAATGHDGGSGAFGWTLLGVGLLLTLVICGAYGTRARLRRDRS